MISDAIQAYLEQHCDQEPPLLSHINRQTHLKVPMPRMLSGHYQGRVLSMLSKMLQPNRILEVGTYTGYATICLAEGLQVNGLIHTIDINEELAERVKTFFAESQYKDQIKFHIGSGENIIPQIDEVFDLVFIDADKKNNEIYYDLVFDKVRQGGLIIVDNVLWSGKVVAEENDKDTVVIRNFNEKIINDHRVEKLILPIRDGLLLILKI
ncbi:MAG: Caffeoyl-CoA O-methyltransferase [Sphingobacteriaceae bacterium]|nr:Caffeoyl-CoA O-methyltransferase [Sphingobacteriaceae bacterium]